MVYYFSFPIYLKEYLKIKINFRNIFKQFWRTVRNNLILKKKEAYNRNNNNIFKKATNLESFKEKVKTARDKRYKPWQIPKVKYHTLCSATYWPYVIIIHVPFRWNLRNRWPFERNNKCDSSTHTHTNSTPWFQSFYVQEIAKFPGSVLPYSAHRLRTTFTHA